jgi:hypothetical protein
VLHTISSWQLEVVGLVPAPQVRRQPDNSNGITQTEFAPTQAAAGTPECTRSHISTFLTSPCVICIDQVVSTGVHQLPALQAVTLCSLLAARLALRPGLLPDQQQVYTRACRLRRALPHAQARRQGRGLTFEEGFEEENWEAGIQVRWQHTVLDRYRSGQGVSPAVVGTKLRFMHALAAK